MSFESKGRIPAGAVLAGCIAVAFAIYGPALSNGFYNEDAEFLLEARELAHDPASIVSLRPQGFRPIWSLYVALLTAVFGMAPAAFFAAGILLHGACAFLIERLARRVMGPTPWALLAPLAYLAFLSHSETTLWIAAHNSTLVVFFSLLAIHAHVAAIERGGRLRDAGAIASVAAALFTKESGITALLWIPLAQAAVFGVRSLRERRSLLLLLAYAVVLAGFVAANEGFRSSLLRTSGDSPVVQRVGAGNLSPVRMLGAVEALYAPAIRIGSSFYPWAGLAILVALLAVPALLRAPSASAAGLAVGMMLTGLLTASLTPAQAPTPSRLYGFATVGAALGLAAFVASTRRFAPAAATAALVLLGWNVAKIREVNASYFGPVSRAQGSFVKQLGAFLPPDRPAIVVLLEPPIANVSHLHNFLRLSYGFEATEISAMTCFPWEANDALARARERDPQALFLAWDPARQTLGVADAFAQQPQREPYEALGAPHTPPRARPLHHFRLSWRGGGLRSAR